MNRYAHPRGHVFYRKMNFARPMISHGHGIYLYDTEGKRYLDGSGGPLVVNIGHGRTQVVEAMSRQLKSAAYTHATMFTSEPLERYAEALTAIVPIPNPRFYFLSSGSEVVEAAIKLARQIQMARGQANRHLVIGRRQSYHGMTMGALSVSGKPAMRHPFLDMMADMPHVSAPYPYREAASGEALATELEEVITQYGPDLIAGFIAEPISGATLGAVVPPNDYWPRIRQVCDKFGILMIADEVLVGMGRTGRWWGIDHWEVVPDILVTSKGVTGGYFPLGFAAVGSEDVEGIRQAFGDFNHGGTYSHHAVGAAAGLATLNIIQEEKLVENSARMGIVLGAKLKAGLEDHPKIGDIRGRGLFWAIEIVKNRQSKKPFPRKMHLAQILWQNCFEKGLITYYSQGCANGTDGDVIMVGPPLIVDEPQIDELVSLLVQSVWEHFAG